jgi:predicted DNA-binding transcriptional regulator AlpA
MGIGVTMVYQVDIQLRPKQVMARIGCSATTFWRLVKEDPDFPKLTRIGKRCTSVSANAIEHYLALKTGVNK